MAAFIVRRLLWMVLLLLLVSALVFAIFYVLPSADPAAAQAGKRPTPQLIETIRRQHGLDDPIPQQYLRYVGDIVLHGDFGYSYQNDEPVLKEIWERLPATLSLTLGALVVWISIAFPIGIVSAVRRGTWVDRLSMGIALVFVSAPVYWLGLIALYLFDDQLGRLPILPGADTYEPLTQDPAAWLGSLVLPWLVLAASFAAIYARLVRGNLIEVMQEDYIRTARAKGLRERTVVLRHGLRSAVTPVVTILGLDLGILLGGAVLTERVFNIPGVGRLAYEAIRNSDLPTIQGTVLFAAFFIIVMNLVVDIAYTLLDPRVRTT
jgi:peptide/nickel transport system permease protein